MMLHFRVQKKKLDQVFLGGGLNNLFYNHKIDDNSLHLKLQFHCLFRQCLSIEKKEKYTQTYSLFREINMSILD